MLMSLNIFFCIVIFVSSDYYITLYVNKMYHLVLILYSQSCCILYCVLCCCFNAEATHRTRQTTREYPELYTILYILFKYLIYYIIIQSQLQSAFTCYLIVISIVVFVFVFRYEYTHRCSILDRASRIENRQLSTLLQPQQSPCVLLLFVIVLYSVQHYNIEYGRWNMEYGDCEKENEEERLQKKDQTFWEYEEKMIIYMHVLHGEWSTLNNNHGIKCMYILLPKLQTPKHLTSLLLLL